MARRKPQGYDPERYPSMRRWRPAHRCPHCGASTTGRCFTCFPREHNEQYETQQPWQEARAYMPSPAQIQFECWLIRMGWTEEDRVSRLPSSGDNALAEKLK